MYSCDSEGSRPPAKITWWKNEFQLNETKELILHDGNTIRSIAKLIPAIEDDQAILTCRAQNPLLSPTSVVEDSRRLVVHYAPRIHLIPGKRMNMSRITENDDVYLECLIHSRPKENIVKWYHQDEQIFTNKSSGIIQSHESLVLQHVKKISSGEYTCEASNPVGTTRSNVLPLNVKFVPICSKSQQLVYGGGNAQLVNVTCSVEAYPEPDGFKWSFNTSAEHVDIPKNLIHYDGCHSTVSYTPLTHLDFGSLLCWAHNEIGQQRIPCVFQVVPASPPETPTNCSAWHEAGTAGEVVVACRPGWDGGLPQNFSLEVKVKNGGDVLAALRGQPVPHFTVTGLAPGTEYLLIIIASNSQGGAPPIQLGHLTPIDIAEKRLSATAADGPTSGENFGILIAVLSGVFSVLLTCFVVLVILIKIRLKRRNAAAALESSSEQQSEVIPDKPDSSGNVIQTNEGSDTKLMFTLPKMKKKSKSDHKKGDFLPGLENLTGNNSKSSANLLSEATPLVASSSSSIAVQDTKFDVSSTSCSLNPLEFQQLPTLATRSYHNQHPGFSTLTASSSVLPLKPDRMFQNINRLSSINSQLNTNDTCLNSLRNIRT